ncbi:MAG: PhoH family protein [Rhodospirillaceae bacterium]|jgi:phosphate starvation-inducible protein PhoH and related proteins|nr:PhoH family protein [Rhodospirillaceae bacterium]MBT5374880.1 PhoH family protein [Rhodospirillaceae bacterium]MBT5751412.1 PhoH family protein [Rhodospirillaceae bacterium]
MKAPVTPRRKSDKKSGAGKKKEKNRPPTQLQFEDNSLVLLLCGEHDKHLDRIERDLGVSITPRGNLLAISGPVDAVNAASKGLNALYARLTEGLNVDSQEIEAMLRLGVPGRETGSETDGEVEGGGEVEGESAGKTAGEGAEDLVIRTRKRHISPRSPQQANYLRALRDNPLVFALGPAGTGKTYLAVASAVALMLKGEVDSIILSRPAVEAGERLGFLPGDLREKVDPYLRPLFDALHDMLPGAQVMKRMEDGDIEVAPLAFMRGRTLSNAYIILDEAQNTTPGQMKMFLTRMGGNSRMVVTGDLTQVDLPAGNLSGLRDAVEILQGVKGVAFVTFSDADVVRHSLVTRIVQAYDRQGREKTAFEDAARKKGPKK